MNRFRLTLSLAVSLLPLGAPFALAQSTITGVVTNKTTNKPAGGDDVTLIRLAQGMQESTKTKTDAHGRFSLAVPDPGGMHLVRVNHDKANYFQPVNPGASTIAVDVFTAAAKVEGVSGEAEVLKVQSEPGGAQLSVVEMFFVKNESTPPKTQFSDRPFEFFLPEGAVVESSVALGPGGMPVRSAPVPLGDPNHYAFIFPLRPGETRFQVSYKVPYTGSFHFDPKPVLPTDTIALVMPKSMKFAPAAGSPYAAVTEETTAQAYAARGAAPTAPLSFTISGTGELPRDSQEGAGAAQGADGGAPATASSTRPGGGLGVPVDPGGENDPWAKYKWWILGGLGLLLAVGAGVMLKSPAPVEVAAGNGGAAAGSRVPAASGAAGRGASGSGGVLAALRDELFTLETERIQNKVSEADYLEQKAALETVLRRALGRADSAS